MQLPQVNAQLTRVSRRTQSKNYTQEEEDNAVVWKGTADAYVMRKLKSALGQRGELNRVQEITIIIPSNLVPPVEVQEGDVIGFTQQGPDMQDVPYSGKAQIIVTPSNLPGVPQYTKIGLENVSA